MATVTRKVFFAGEDGRATSTEWWLPSQYREYWSPYYDTEEEATAWAEAMVQSAIDYIATLTPSDLGYGAFRLPRYQIWTQTEVRGEGEPTNFTNGT